MGLRTRDEEGSRQIPNQLLLGGGIDNPFRTGTGRRYHRRAREQRLSALPDIKQKWGGIAAGPCSIGGPQLHERHAGLSIGIAAGTKGSGTNPPASISIVDRAVPVPAADL